MARDPRAATSWLTTALRKGERPVDLLAARGSWDANTPQPFEALAVRRLETAAAPASGMTEARCQQLRARFEALRKEEKNKGWELKEAGGRAARRLNEELFAPEVVPTTGATRHHPELLQMVARCWPRERSAERRWVPSAVEAQRAGDNARFIVEREESRARGGREGGREKQEKLRKRALAAPHILAEDRKLFNNPYVFANEDLLGRLESPDQGVAAAALAEARAAASEGGQEVRQERHEKLRKRALAAPHILAEDRKLFNTPSVYANEDLLGRLESPDRGVAAAALVEARAAAARHVGAKVSTPCELQLIEEGIPVDEATIKVLNDEFTFAQGGPVLGDRVFYDVITATTGTIRRRTSTYYRLRWAGAKPKGEKRDKDRAYKNCTLQTLRARHPLHLTGVAV